MRALGSGRNRLVLVVAGAALWACAAPGVSRAAGGLVAARPYHSRVPSKIDPQRKYPLVVVLHGLGGSSDNVERYYQLDTLVEELGFLAAYPDGSEETAKGGQRRRYWNATDGCCDFFGSGVDDVAYLDAVIDDMSARYHVDPKRVFVMGLSNGGYMSYRYACDRASRVAAIVSQAGAMWSDVNRCKPTEPVAVLQIHGTADPRVPYDGGSPGGGRPSAPSAHQSVADWVAIDKCKATADTSSPPLDLVAQDSPSLSSLDAETTVEKWTGCRGVELWSMRGAGHVPRPNQPAWARAIYGWLSAHPKQ